MPPLDVPVRDAFVIVDGDAESDDGMRLPTEPDERGAFLHNLLNNELCAAELSARNSHEHPDMPWSFHVDMARQCWDQMRHAQVLDRALHEEGLLSWGGRPVSFADFTDVYPLDLLGRLALFDGTSGQVAIGDPGQEPLAAVFHRMRTDEVVHAERARRWGAHLLGGDGAAFQQRARELRRMRGTSPTQPVTTS